MGRWAALQNAVIVATAIYLVEQARCLLDLNGQNAHSTITFHKQFPSLPSSSLVTANRKLLLPTAIGSKSFLNRIAKLGLGNEY
jgi:hypothetical protein